MSTRVHAPGVVCIQRSSKQSTQVKKRKEKVHQTQRKIVSLQLGLLTEHQRGNLHLGSRLITCINYRHRLPYRQVRDPFITRRFIFNYCPIVNVFVYSALNHMIEISNAIFFE